MHDALKICWLLLLGLVLWPGAARAQEVAEELSGTAEVFAPAEKTSKKISDEPLDELTSKPAPGEPATSELTSKLMSKPTSEQAVTSRLPWQNGSAERTAAPDVYLLPDESGKLRKVLGFKYEDFLKAWQHKNGASGNSAGRAVRPRFVLDSWGVTGKVLETHARLRVEFKITVQSEGWTDIPLQLKAFIVQKLTIEDQVEGECLVFAPQRHGHVVWLSGKVGQQRTVVLEGLARLKQNAGKQSFELHVPRATSTEFGLFVPNTFTRFEKSPESTLTAVAIDFNAIELRLVGQANPIRLSWKPAEEKAVNKASLIEVEGQTQVQLDRRRIHYSTTLKINSFDRLLEQIQVRLPRGAQLMEGEKQVGYEIQKVGSTVDLHKGQLVKIRRLKPQANPWKVSLSAETAWESLSRREELRIEGFEVLDAFRQSGTLLLEVDNRMQAYFDTHDAIDQIRVSQATTASKGHSILGQFRYTRFPGHLAVFATPRPQRVTFQPKCKLSLSAEEARLNVTYDYQLTGAQIFKLRLDLRGWDLVETPSDPGGLINLSGIVVRSNGNLILPLVDTDTQKLRLHLKLRKQIQLGENTFPLPEPLDALATDGELVVDFSESLKVTPEFKAMIGLGVVSKVGTQGERGVDWELGQELIHLRTFLAQSTFVADVQQRQRQVTVMGKTRVELDQQIIRVQQRLNYQSKYQPVSQLLLSLPEAMWQNDSLTVSLAGEPLSIGPATESSGKTPEESAEEKGSDLRQMVISLPRPLQDEIPIEIAYEEPAPKWVAEEWSLFQLPLAAPQDALSQHTVVVNAAQPVLVTANQRASSDAWQLVGEEDRAEADVDADALRLQTKEKVAYLSLHAQLDLAEKVQLANLERAWIQTWVSSGQRQDRAVFRFRSAYATVVAQLPRAFQKAEIEVLLDRVPCSFELLDDNRLAVVLPTTGQRASHTLELRYQTPTKLPTWGRLKFALPRLKCHEANAPIYWQLILPQGWILAGAPKKLDPDYWLGWKNYHWGRQPALSQADLEQKTVAASAEVPTRLSTQYVFRAFDVPAVVKVAVVRQGWLLLVCALAAFGVGLLCLYTSLASSGLFWLGLALFFMVGVFSYPELALLGVEVILAGGLMTFVTKLLQRVFVVQKNGVRVATQQSSEVTESWQQQPLLGGGAAPSGTTATMPIDRPPS